MGEAPHKASTFGHHFCSKSRKEGIFGVVKCVATSETSKFQLVRFECCFAWMLWKLGRIDGDPVLRETRIWATWEYVSSDGGGQQGMIVMAAQLTHDRVEMECLEGAWETLEGNTRC
ncbi:hypothetical protein HKD37_03G007392 [Glycine soja]